MIKDDSLTVSTSLTLEELERLYIQAHVDSGKHPTLHALATSLGLSRHSMHRRIVKHNIDISRMKGSR